MGCITVGGAGGWGACENKNLTNVKDISCKHSSCSVSRVPSRTVAHKRCSFKPLPFTNKWDVPSQLHLCIKRPGRMFALKPIHQRKDINKGRTHCVTSFELILTPMTIKDDKKCAGEPFERITAIFLFSWHWDWCAWKYSTVLIKAYHVCRHEARLGAGLIVSSCGDGNVCLRSVSEDQNSTWRENRKKINKEGEGRTVALGVAAAPITAPLFWDECLDQWEGRNRRLGKQLVQPV